jgi:putative hemolysin
MLSTLIPTQQPGIALLATASLAEQEYLAQCGTYRVRLARTEQDRLAAFRLRFMVFNLELNEGLQSAFVDGYDTDPFDAVCDHLIVEHIASGAVVGTYRLQSGDTAGRNLGYYSEQEFDFAPFEALRSQIVELGRACVHRDHRTSDVLNLLWKGIARYARMNGAHMLIGCCSLTSQDPFEGLAAFERLQSCLAEPEIFTAPTAAFALPHVEGPIPQIEVPRLLRAYLALGAKICAAPAIDRAFGTIDYLTLLDLDMLHPRVARRFQ